MIKPNGLFAIQFGPDVPRGSVLALAMDAQLLDGASMPMIIDHAGVTIAIRKRSGRSASETDKHLWSIVRESEETKLQFLASNEAVLFQTASIEQLVQSRTIAKEQLDQLCAARPIRSKAPKLANHRELGIEWSVQRPWIDADDANIDDYVNGLRSRSSYDLHQKLSQWRDQGYVVFEAAASADLIEELLFDIDTFRNSFDQYNLPMEISGRQIQSAELQQYPSQEIGVKINQVHCFSGAAAKLSLTYFVCDFLRHVFQYGPAVMQSLTFSKGSQQPTHVDFPYVRHQQMLSYLAASWIALEDISLEAGPLAYFVGGHKTNVTGFFDWGNGSIVQTEQSTSSPQEFARYLDQRMQGAGIQATPFTAKRGDVLIWHGNLPHQGTQVLDERLTRRSYVTHYTAHPYLPEWQLGQSENETLRENGGICTADRLLVGRKKMHSWKKHFC